MPTYTFKKPDGTIFDAYAPIAGEGGPCVGESFKVDGELCVRVASYDTIVVGDGAMKQKGKYPYLSNRLPTTIRGCSMVRDPKSGRRKPLIESIAHEREVAAINDLQKDGEGV